MIIQGTNRPLVIKPIGAPDIAFIRVSMWDENRDLIKVWNKEDMTFDERGYIICPITEIESVQFYPGMCKIEINIKDADGRKYMIPTINECIVAREDKEVSADETRSS